MKVWEALDLFSSLYTHTVPYEPLLKQWGLADKRNAAFGNLSGGQKQRLFIALALVNDPEVVFLDELTSGLDPQARRATWELVRTIRAQGKTVVLVTHFMDEAEHLCDRIAIVDRGKIIALDTPAGLVKALDEERRIVFRCGAGMRPVAFAVSPAGKRSDAHRPPGDRFRRHGRTACRGGGPAGRRGYCVPEPAHGTGRSGGCLSAAYRAGDSGFMMTARRIAQQTGERSPGRACPIRLSKIGSHFRARNGKAA